MFALDETPSDCNNNTMWFCTLRYFLIRTTCYRPTNFHEQGRVWLIRIAIGLPILIQTTASA